MKRILLTIAIFVSGLIPQKLTLNSNQFINSGELRDIVERASRSSQKVFVEDFTGLN